MAPGRACRRRGAGIIWSMMARTPMITRYSGGIAIVDVTGPLRHGSEADLLHQELTTLIENGQRAILVNLAKAGNMDSAGLGTIVGAYASMVKRGGKLHLLAPGRRVREMLRATQTESLFAIDDDEAAALGRLHGAGSANVDRY